MDIHLFDYSMYNTKFWLVTCGLPRISNGASVKCETRSLNLLSSTISLHLPQCRKNKKRRCECCIVWCGRCWITVIGVNVILSLWWNLIWTERRKCGVFLLGGRTDYELERSQASGMVHYFEQKWIWYFSMTNQFDILKFPEIQETIIGSRSCVD